MTEKAWVDYAGVIQSRKKMIIAATLVCALAAGLGYFIMPKTYESGLALDVGIVSYASADASKPTKDVTTVTIEPVMSVRDMILSKPFLAEVIKELKLDTTPEKLSKKVKAKVNEDLKEEELNRQIIITTKSVTPEKAKLVADTVAGLVIERHRQLFEQAMENRLAYEETLKEQIKVLSRDLDNMRGILNAVYSKGNPNTASLVLLQANIQDKEEQVTDLRRELSQAQLLDKTNLKSANTRVSVPSYLPGAPTWSLTRVAAVGLLLGLMISSGYYIAREAMRLAGSVN